MTEKMTKRENFLAVIDALSVNPENEHLVDFIKNQIELIDRKTAKAKAKKAEDNLMPVVMAALTDELQTISQIVDAIGDPTVTPAKVSNRLNKVAATEEVVKETVVVDKRKLVAYRLA